MSKTFIEIFENKMTRIFFLFAICCCILGALVQWIGLPSIDHDELEAIRWGATKSWFVDKHPPLVGFVSFWWAKFTGFNNLGIFLLSKIFALSSLIIIYSLNRQFLSIHFSLIATAAYGSTYAYISLMSQLDANGILHPLWPLFCLTLWKTLNSNKLIYWILLGFVSSLAILGKYQSALLLLTALVLILSSKEFRKYFIEFKIYISLIIFVLILSPHLYAYIKSDYSLTSYIIGRGSEGSDFFTGRLSILSFVFTQALTWLFGYFILILSLRKNIKFKILKKNLNLNNSKIHFLFFMGFILPISPIIVSLISGASLLGSWGLVSWFLFPTLTLSLFKDETKSLKLQPYLYFTPIYIFIMALIVILNNYFEIARPTPIPMAMREIDKHWSSNFNTKLDTVITNSRPAQGMSFYSKYKPQVIYGQANQFTWILDNNKCTNGPTLIITDNTKTDTNFIKNQVKVTNTQAFSTIVDVSPKRFKATTTSNLELKITGYLQPICFY